MSPRERIRLATALEDLVRDAFSSQLGEARPPPPKARIRDKANKWLATSAWQKAIRRGAVATARLMAAGLHHLDPEYPWRRLPVIALEDVGAANPLLVAQVVWVAGKPHWRRRNGGDLEILLMLTERLARSPKDRVACDLEVWTDYDAGLHQMRQELGRRPQSALIEDVVNPEVTLARRHLALRYLAGTKVFPGANLVPDRPGSFAAVVDAGQAMGLHEDALTIVLWARHKAGSMALSLMLAFEMRGGAEDEAMLEPDPIVELPMIGLYPSYAVDVHCHQGKRAIAYFAKPNLNSWRRISRVLVRQAIEIIEVMS